MEKKYTEGMRGEAFGETFTTGDVVGCGIQFAKQEIFFTKNGKYLGVAFRKVKGVLLFPTIGLHSPGETVLVNFGPLVGQKFFKFDIEEMIREQKQKEMSEVSKINVHVGDVNSIIRNYLLHYGYEETLKSFEAACGGMKSESAHQTLHNRKLIRKLILDGEIEEAIKIISQLYPDLLQNHDNTLFLLQCQLFIEMIKRSKIDDAIACAQTVLSSFRSKLDQSEEKLLQDVLGLLAYSNPLQSPLSYLLHIQQRESVADELNKSILSLEKAPKSQPTLERLLRHLVVTHLVLREENGGMGEKFSLKNYL